MAQDTGREPGARAYRVAGLAVLVVLAVVGARARAAGQTPPVPTPAASVTEIFMRIGALTVMVAAVLLLLVGGRMRGTRAAAAGAKKKKKPPGPPNRRVIIASLIGLLLALAVQLLGNATRQDQPQRPPPKIDVKDRDVATSPLGRDQRPGQGQEDTDLVDEIVLIAAVVTLGVLIFVLLRRETLTAEDEIAEEEQEAIARAVRAGRAAVADRTITDPREAIIACFAAMEAALADQGGPVTPQDADTPAEVLNRGVEQASLPAEPARTLLRLFREARFSTHPIGEGDRADADAALGVLLRALGPTTARPSAAASGELSGDPR